MSTRHRHRQRERHMNRQTDRQTDRQRSALTTADMSTDIVRNNLQVTSATSKELKEYFWWHRDRRTTCQLCGTVVCIRHPNHSNVGLCPHSAYVIPIPPMSASVHTLPNNFTHSCTNCFSGSGRVKLMTDSRFYRPILSADKIRR